jgi:hypothetical protein
VVARNVWVHVVEDAKESCELLDYGKDSGLGLFVLRLVSRLSHIEPKKLIGTFEVLYLVLVRLLYGVRLEREGIVGVVNRLMPNLLPVVRLLHPAKERVVVRIAQLGRVEGHVGSRDFIKESTFKLDGNVTLLVDPFCVAEIVLAVLLYRVIADRRIIIWRRSVVGRGVFAYRMGIIEDVVFTFEVIQVGLIPVLLILIVIHLNDSGSLLRQYYLKLTCYNIKIFGVLNSSIY